MGGAMCDISNDDDSPLSNINLTQHVGDAILEVVVIGLLTLAITAVIVAAIVTFTPITL
jgi:hypothetical protein